MKTKVNQGRYPHPRHREPRELQGHLPAPPLALECDADREIGSGLLDQDRIHGDIADAAQVDLTRLGSTGRRPGVREPCRLALGGIHLLMDNFSASFGLVTKTAGWARPLCHASQT